LFAGFTPLQFIKGLLGLQYHLNNYYMTQIVAYVNFNGNCREAMSFYKDCIGGELDLQIIKDSPIAAQCPSAIQNQVLHATLKKDDLVLMGSDMIGPDGLQEGNNFGLMLNCSSEEEINLFFELLSEGGKVIDPLSVKFWGATFGAITDKFGKRWMLHYDQRMDAEREKTATDKIVTETASSN
jgi:PhnB protein